MKTVYVETLIDGTEEGDRGYNVRLRITDGTVSTTTCPINTETLPTKKAAEAFILRVKYSLIGQIAGDNQRLRKEIVDHGYVEFALRAALAGKINDVDQLNALLLEKDELLAGALADLERLKASTGTFTYAGQLARIAVRKIRGRL